MALIGFGFDSVIEVASAAAVAWQFSARDPEARDPEARDPEARECAALRVIALSFLSTRHLRRCRVRPRAVRGGRGLPVHRRDRACRAVAAGKPVLSHAQRRTGRELGSRSAVADSKQTLLCTYLSGVLLVGLLLNSLLGWSCADPIAALVIAAVAVKEGREAWRGHRCC